MSTTSHDPELFNPVSFWTRTRGALGNYGSEPYLDSSVLRAALRGVVRGDGLTLTAGNHQQLLRRNACPLE